MLLMDNHYENRYPVLIRKWIVEVLWPAAKLGVFVWRQLHAG
jgi:hypothetical protein